MLVRISSLPTISTRTAGTSVMPSSSATSLARKRANGSAAPPLDDQLDDVARQHEDQRRQHRQVGGRQRVEDELAEEVGREPRRAVGDREHRDEHDDAARAMPARISRGLSRNGRRGDCWRPARPARALGDRTSRCAAQSSAHWTKVNFAWPSAAHGPTARRTRRCAWAVSRRARRNRRRRLLGITRAERYSRMDAQLACTERIVTL